MKELPNPVFPLSLVAMPGGHLIDLFRQWSASGRGRSIRMGMNAFKLRGTGLAAKPQLRAA